MARGALQLLAAALCLGAVGGLKAARLSEELEEAERVLETEPSRLRDGEEGGRRLLVESRERRKSRWTSNLPEILHVADGQEDAQEEGKHQRRLYHSQETVMKMGEDSGRDEGKVGLSERVPMSSMQGSKEGCILYMDNRKMEYKTVQEDPWYYMEERGSNMPYWLSSRFINRLYAKRHGYRFVATSGSEFVNVSEPRASSWLKIRFLRQQLQCCCQWAFYIDSDAYFRMDDHSLSVEDWLRKLHTKDYFAELEKQGVHMDNQTWFPEEPIRLVDPLGSDTQLIALFPRNGDNQGGWCGSFNPVFFPDPPELCINFINAGIVMMRNSSLALQFLDDWYNDPVDIHFTKHPWEQHRLNEICSKYKENLVLVPFRELTGPDGRQVRHVWSTYDAKHPDGRNSVLRSAVLGMVAHMQEHPELLD